MLTVANTMDQYLDQHYVNTLAKHQSTLGQYMPDISPDSQSSVG